MTKHPDLPKEAVEALAERYYGRQPIDESYPGDEEKEASAGMRRARLLAADDLQAAAPAIRKQERERVREALTGHVGEWALGLLKRGATDEDWTELRRLMQITDPPDTDDLCTCGHVRHEHHTWNENASVGCAFCKCQQFRLDLAALDQEASDG